MNADYYKTKWCPFARVALLPTLKEAIEGAPSGLNRVDEGTAIGYIPSAHSFCIGPACMAWRVHKNLLSHGMETPGHCGLVPTIAGTSASYHHP